MPTAVLTILNAIESKVPICSYHDTCIIGSPSCPEMTFMCILSLFAVDSQVAIGSQLGAACMSVCNEGRETVRILLLSLLLPSSSRVPQRWWRASSQNCYVHASSVNASQFGHVHTSPSALGGYQLCDVGLHAVFEALFGLSRFLLSRQVSPSRSCLGIL